LEQIGTSDDIRRSRNILECQKRWQPDSGNKKGKTVTKQGNNNVINQDTSLSPIQDGEGFN